MLIDEDDCNQQISFKIEEWTYISEDISAISFVLSSMTCDSVLDLVLFLVFFFFVVLLVPVFLALIPLVSRFSFSWSISISSSSPQDHLEREIELDADSKVAMLSFSFSSSFLFILLHVFSSNYANYQNSESVELWVCYSILNQARWLNT
jgi:hypothetical protein